MGLTVKSQRPILTWTASKRLGGYITFPLHRNRGYNEAKARVDRLENRAVFETRAMALQKFTLRLCSQVFFSFLFLFLIRL